MELCDTNHEQVAYVGARFTSCPVCSAIDEISDLKSKVQELSEEISNHTCAE